MLLEITAMNHRGEGVGRFEGKVYFVPFTVPGDIVEVVPGKQSRRFGYARMQKIVRPSADRATPLCEHMDTCGGSNLHHIRYKAQLELKRKLVVDALERIGNLHEIKVLPTIGMENPYHYRNKAVFHVQTDPVAIGFFQTGSHIVVPVKDCCLVPPEWGAIITFLERSFVKMGAAVQDVGELILRQSYCSGEIMIVLAGKHKVLNGKNWSGLAREIRQRFAKVSTVASSDGHEEVCVLSGQGVLIEELAGLTFAISPPAFFQVNTIMAEVLVKKVLEYGKPQNGEQVIDAYCGIGTLSLPLARHASKVIGIEQNLASIRSARQNADLNRIDNAEFISGDFEKVLPRLVPSLKTIDLLVVDPPRKGLSSSVLNSIVKMKPDRMVYVSCHTGTLARDLSVLVGQGYQVRGVQPIDLFPHTPHIEICVFLSNRE